MPPEPTLSLGSPRTQAAMKVLGILPKDMQPRERQSFPEGLPGEIRHEAFETKRRQLMHSVSGMALDRSLDLTKSASAGELGGMSASTNAFLMDVMAKEKASIDKMHKRAKADVQKIVIEEMDAKKQVEIRNAKLEEHRKRMVELKKKQDERIKETKKEALKKYEKSVEVRQRADRKVEEESQALMAELVEKGEKVEVKLQEREAGWVENRVTKQAARVENYARIAKFKAGDMKVREKAYEKIVEKTKASEDRLTELNAEMWATQAAKTYKTDEVTARARQTLNSAQAKKDEAYLERIKVHEKKKEVREAMAKEVQKEYAAKVKKDRAAFEKNYEQALKEREAHLEHLCGDPRMTKSMSESYTTQPAWQTEASAKAFETHKTMGELRQLNLQLLRRAHQHQQQQALNKILDMRYRVKALQDSKDQAQFRRFDMIKNCAIEKHDLSFKVAKIRDAPPEKMNGLLVHMGLDPVGMGKEGDEEADAHK